MARAGSSRLSDHIGKPVSLQLVDSSSRVGYLYAVDPSNHSAVLLIPDSDTDGACAYHVSVVFAHAISSFSESSIETPSFEDAIASCHLLSQQAKHHTEATSAEVLQRRRDDLITCLKQRKIPFRVEGATIIAMNDALRIEPPYLQSSCSSSNAVMLGRVSSLLFGGSSAS